MKQEFLDFLLKLMNNDEEFTKSIMTPNVESYIAALKNEEVKEKPLFTEKGKMILAFLQQNHAKDVLKSKDIACEMEISSRTVSGSMRKLVSDGFCEKVGQDPVMYMITEKGLNLNID